MFIILAVLSQFFWSLDVVCLCDDGCMEKMQVCVYFLELISKETTPEVGKN